MDLKNYKLPEKSKITNERQLVIKDLLEGVNKTSRKPFKPSFIAFKTSHLSLPDLKYLLRECEKARNFGAYFFYSLKTK